MPVTDGPWIRNTDLLGRLPKYKNTGNIYVLVFIDYFTKAVELVAVPDAKAETVARAFLERVILRHGATLYLHSDRGKQYLNRLFAETCKIFQVHKTQTTSFHSSYNGQSERMISNNLNSLSKLLQDKHDIWDTYLLFVQYAYNTTPCLDSTSYSPIFLNHGRYTPMPIYTQLSQIIDLPNTINKFVEHLVEQQQFANTVAESIMLERKHLMQEQSQLHKRDPHFNVEDVVYNYL